MNATHGRGVMPYYLMNSWHEEELNVSCHGIYDIPVRGVTFTLTQNMTYLEEKTVRSSRPKQFYEYALRVRTQESYNK